MPSSPRPNKKAMKLVYAILKTPKEMRQDTQKKPSEKTIRVWQREAIAGK